MPTSSTAISTSSRSKCAKAIAVVISKNVRPQSFAARCRSSSTTAGRTCSTKLTSCCCVQGRLLTTKPLFEPLQMGRCIETNTELGLNEHGGDHRRRGALPFGTCDMDDVQVVVRITQPLKQVAHPVEVQALASERERRHCVRSQCGRRGSSARPRDHVRRLIHPCSASVPRDLKGPEARRRSVPADLKLVRSRTRQPGLSRGETTGHGLPHNSVDLGE